MLGDYRGLTDNLRGHTDSISSHLTSNESGVRTRPSTKVKEAAVMVDSLGHEVFLVLDSSMVGGGGESEQVFVYILYVRLFFYFMKVLCKHLFGTVVYAAA